MELQCKIENYLCLSKYLNYTGKKLMYMSFPPLVQGPHSVATGRQAQTEGQRNVERQRFQSC